MQKCAAYHFRDLRNDRVSEGKHSVHPAGNPIARSYKLGGAYFLCKSLRIESIASRSWYACHDRPCRICSTLGIDGVSESLVLGVGHNPDSISAVWQSNAGSSYAMPFRVIPERGQVSENFSKPSRKQRCDVLHDDVVRSYFANEARVVTPQSRPLACKPCPRARKTDVLAWKSSADDIDADSVSSQSACGERAHIFVTRDAGPVLCEDSSAE